MRQETTGQPCALRAYRRRGRAGWPYADRVTTTADGAPGTHLDDPAHRAAVLDLLGLLAYGELMSFARHADDAEHAPDLPGRITLSRMASGELSHLDALERYIGSLGGDLETAMLTYADVLGDFDARTVPRDWWERLMKTYVGYGLVLDFQREVSGRLDAQTRAVVDEVLADNGYADFVVSVLAPVLAAEPQLGARMALWGRRVVGEALGLAQHALIDHPSLVVLLTSGVDDEAEAAKVLNRLAGGHARRMNRLGLTA
jgi:hypothetical protein